MLSNHRHVAGGPTSRIILGIDPGVAIVGYAVVEARGDALTMIVCDVIRTPKDLQRAEELERVFVALWSLCGLLRLVDEPAQWTDTLGSALAADLSCPLAIGSPSDTGLPSRAVEPFSFSPSSTSLFGLP
jgi:hypothetical protein